VKINPIAAWSDDEMQAYIDANDVLGQSACLRGLSVDRLRAVHGEPAEGADPAAAAGRYVEDGMRLHAS